MSVKTTVLTFSTGAVLTVSPLVHMTFAQTRTLNPTRAAMREVRQEARVTLKKDRADAEITRRIASMTDLITRVNAMKRVSSTEKSTLVSQIQAQITSLTALKAKIDADTDAATLATDKQTIVTSYRIYLLFMPKIRIMANADKILDVAAEMKTKTTKSDVIAKIVDAQTKAQAAIDAVLPLTPQGYPGNKPTLVTARQDLATALTDLKAARAEMK